MSPTSKNVILRTSSFQVVPFSRSFRLLERVVHRARRRDKNQLYFLDFPTESLASNEMKEQKKKKKERTWKLDRSNWDREFISSGEFYRRSLRGGHSVSRDLRSLLGVPAKYLPMLRWFSLRGGKVLRVCRWVHFISFAFPESHRKGECRYNYFTAVDEIYLPIFLIIIIFEARIWRDYFIESGVSNINILEILFEHVRIIFLNSRVNDD